MPKYQVSKSIEIAAPPQSVYEVVADYHTWTRWSPWLLAEPDAKVTVSPEGAQVGSRYQWEGAVTGQGELEHKRLEPGRMIEDDLRFLKPFKALARTAFRLEPVGGKTRLTWTMDAGLPWFLFWLVPTMKTFIGMDYARGLQMIKDLVETGGIPARTVVHGVERIQPVRMAGIAGTCSVEAVSQSMEGAFQSAQREFERAGWKIPAEAISVYTRFDVKQGAFDYISGYQIPESVQLPAGSPLKTWSCPAGNAFRVEQQGPYRHLGNGWSAANQICRYRKLKQSRVGTFEIYRTMPGEVPDAQIRTDIYLPLRG